MDMEFTEKLIRAVRNRPILYVPTHPDFKSLAKKVQAWKDIQRELNEEVETLKTKWKNLKDTYKKYKHAKFGNNYPNAKKLRSWVWADHMSFIEPTAVHDTTFDDDDNPTNIEENTLDNNQELNQEHDPQETQSRRLKRRLEPIETVFIQKKRARNTIRKVDLKCDGVDLLFLGYADSFRKLSRRKQIKVKFEIAKVMMEAELGDLESERCPYSGIGVDLVPENSVEDHDDEECYEDIQHETKPNIVD